MMREILKRRMQVCILVVLTISGGIHALAQTSPRERLEVFLTSPQKLAALRRGVQAMKDRKPSDPTSWFYQAAVHGVTQEAIDAATVEDPGVANVDKKRFWNRCPHGEQNSADFLIWHRAYVYYFERILRQASGDPTLSLPYWNYTDPARRTFPSAFATDAIDPQTGRINSLFDSRRELAFMFGLYSLTDGAVSPDEAFNETAFFGSSEDTGFAGGVWDDNPDTQGRIESRPHNMLHFAIGGQIGEGEAAAAGSMASVPTAAFDPIFWVHHSNIDRLWTTWECTSTTPRVWGSVPDQAWLEAKPWDFNDINGGIETRSRLFYLDRRNLSLSYDTDRADCSPLSTTSPLTGVTPPIGPLSFDKKINSFTTKLEMGKAQISGRFAPDKPSSVSIPLTPVGPADGLKAKISKSKFDRPVRIYLEIQDLKLEGIPSTGFDVYVNLPEGVTPSRTSLNFLGTLPLFGHVGAKGHGNHGASATRSIRFDITRLLLLSPADPNSVNLLIVPFDLLAPAAGQPRIQRPGGFSHGTIRVLVMEGSAK